MDDSKGCSMPSSPVIPLLYTARMYAALAGICTLSGKKAFKRALPSHMKFGQEQLQGSRCEPIAYVYLAWLLSTSNNHNQHISVWVRGRWMQSNSSLIWAMWCCCPTWHTAWLARSSIAMRMMWARALPSSCRPISCSA